VIANKAKPHLVICVIRVGVGSVFRKCHIFSIARVIKQTAKGTAGSRYLMPSWAGLMGKATKRNGKARQVKISIILRLT